MLLLLEARRKASDLCAQKGVSCTHHDSLPAFEEQFRTLFFPPNSIIISPLMVRNSRFRKLPLQTLGKKAVPLFALSFNVTVDGRLLNFVILKNNRHLEESS